MLFPQLAKQADITDLRSFIENDAWVMEQKLDGNRILLMSPGADMAPTCITRNGSLYSKKIPQAIKDFRFPEGEWVLDGELVGDTYWVFDMPQTPITGPSDPLHIRRTALLGLLGNTSHPFKLVPQARTPEEKIGLASTALQKNFEGLLLKRRDSPYRSGGRTEEWLKVKFVSTVDCIVTGVRTDGKDSVDLALVKDLGGIKRELIDVGRASLIGKEKQHAISAGDVLEVRYLYTGAGGRLYQPTILRKRFDKRPDECTTDQLKYVNKEVLEAL